MQNRAIRQSNFELMRITSMLMIIVWHVFLHTQKVFRAAGNLSYVMQFTYLLIIVHVNSFILLSGYFQYNKKVKYKKIINLIGEVLFYNVFFVVLTIIFDVQKMTKLEVVETTSILNMRNYWFINYYCILYFFVPYLNKLIAHMSQKDHKNLIVTFFITVSVIPFVTHQATLNNTASNLIHFFFLYIVGAYLAKYDIKNSHFLVGNSNRKNRMIFLGIFLMCATINFLLYRFGLELQDNHNTVVDGLSGTIRSGCLFFSNPLIVVQSIAYFLFFSTLNFKSKFINKVAVYTFGMYLAHENYLFYNNFYNLTRLSAVDDRMLSYVILCLVGLGLFLAAFVLEFIRKTIATLLSKLKPIKKINNKIENFCNNF